MRFLAAVFNFYRPQYVLVLVREFKRRQYNAGTYARWFWFTSNYIETAKERQRFSGSDIWLVLLLGLVGITELVMGTLLIIGGVRDEIVGGVAFGTAVILLTPVMLGVLVPILYMLAVLLAELHPKNLGRDILCVLLEWQARRLRKKYQFKVVAVAGSVGKTSTKLAIARTLHAAGKQVRFQEGNYNVRITVPLVLFGQPLPSLVNVIAWVKILFRNELTLMHGYAYDAAVLELGTDRPGEMAKFAYLKPDITVLTSIAPEHMENFGSLEAVAHEELTVTGYSKRVLVNASDVALQYRKSKTLITYGVTDEKTAYFAKAIKETVEGQAVTITYDGKKLFATNVQFLGSQGRKIVLAAAAVSHMLDIEPTAIAKAVEVLKPFAGRLQTLKGIHGTTLLDDSYNATPTSVQAALSVLVSLKAPHRIAVLGSMNELGDFAIDAHKSVGALLQPSEIDLVVTIGSDAEAYVAPAARENGCEVQSFRNPKKAGEYVKKQLKKGAVVLVKGSQNGVFSEEALKVLLADPGDSKKLVRQSPYWMKQKHKLLQTK